MSVQETTPETVGDSGRILDSLEVQNFRAFRHLTVEKLGRVNLITGKNNVGKTSLLEALWVYADQGAARVIRRLLSMRDELPTRMRVYEKSSIRIQEPSAEALLRCAWSLFHNNRTTDGDLAPITIGPMSTSDATISLNLAWFERRESPDSERPTLVQIPSKDIEQFAASPFLVINRGNERVRRYAVEQLSRVPFGQPTQGNLNCEAIWTDSLTQRRLDLLWDDVLRFDLEGEVVDALRLIVPDVSKIVVVSDVGGSDTRNVYLRLMGEDEPARLKRFGDGVNRLFLIALAMIKAANGLLLIDEVENGIHYSVQPDVWKFVFTLARRLNVQVFATTHSWDCIEAFQQAAAEDDDPNSGVLIRLQNKGDNVVSTVFSEQDLAVITREGIEVR